MAVGYFNGDGKPDVAVAADLSVYVFLGNGDGTFQASIRTITGMTVYAFAAGDFNGDGKADLVGLSNSTPLFTLISKGDGTFASPVAVTGTTGTLNIVATGDFNHDGKLDFAAASTGQNVPGTIQAFLGNGDGTFQAVKTSTGVVAPYGFAVADFNGDGNADLVIGDGSQINVSVFLSNGDGTFHSTATFTPFGFPAVGDFNQDGKPDLVINNNANPFAAVYLGKGDGTFEDRK